MTAVLYIFFALLLLYAVLVFWLGSGFLRTKSFRAVSSAPLPVTLIICARNEEKHIVRCLDSILLQDYPRGLLQLIVINDASTDATVQLAERVLKHSGLNYRIISNRHQKGKKQSITFAMQFANHELIVLRDADTYTTSYSWLQSISDYYGASRSDLIIAPVAIADNYGLLWALQAIENNILAVFAAGSCFYHKPFLCNGANLAFTKSLFAKTNGYASHLQHASGDDIFLLEDAKKIPDVSIGYLKSTYAVVHTYPGYSLGQLLRQKIRWASKFKNNSNALNLVLSIAGFCVNAAWLWCFIGSFFAIAWQPAFLLFVFFKLAIDFLLLFLASGFIKNRLLWWFALPVGCVYPLYACLVGLASLTIKPRWK